jgi:hypothetical protein
MRSGGGFRSNQYEGKILVCSSGYRTANELARFVECSPQPAADNPSGAAAGRTTQYVGNYDNPTPLAAPKLRISFTKGP